jgi:hypothetical protein
MSTIMSWNFKKYPLSLEVGPKASQFSARMFEPTTMGQTRTFVWNYTRTTTAQKIK